MKSDPPCKLDHRLFKMQKGRSHGTAFFLFISASRQCSAFSIKPKPNAGQGLSNQLSNRLLHDFRLRFGILSTGSLNAVVELAFRLCAAWPNRNPRTIRQIVFQDIAAGESFQRRDNTLFFACGFLIILNRSNRHRSNLGWFVLAQGIQYFLDPHSTFLTF